MAKKKQEVVNTEKEKKIIELTERFQAAFDLKDCQYLSDFLTKWNKNNKEKIQDIVKIKDQIIIHLSQYTISVHSDYVRL